MLEDHIDLVATDCDVDDQGSPKEARIERDESHFANDSAHQANERGNGNDCPLDSVCDICVL